MYKGGLSVFFLIHCHIVGKYGFLGIYLYAGQVGRQNMLASVFHSMTFSLASPVVESVLISNVYTTLRFKVEGSMVSRVVSFPFSPFPDLPLNYLQLVHTCRKYLEYWFPVLLQTQRNGLLSLHEQG